jgi:type I restriction enzyme S subunit
MKNSEVKPGYKQTVLGWIPEDWDVRSLGDIYDAINTPSFSRDNLTYEKTSNEILYIHYGDIHATFKTELLDLSKENRVPYLKDEFCSEKLNYLRDGDLVVADASEDYEGIGACIELINVTNKKVIGGLHTVVLRATKGSTATGFNTYIFRNYEVKLSLMKIATGISVYGISKSNLLKLLVPLPPLFEQKAIAKVLSTWDRAIEKIQELIAQKELRKKNLMQKLLTGKKRLPGFIGEWKGIEVSSCFEFIKSYSITRDGLSKINNNVSPYCIHYGDIHAFYESDFLDFGKQKSIPQIINGDQLLSKTDYLKEGDIILADASEDYEGVGESVVVVNIGTNIAVGGLHTIVLRSKNEQIDKYFSGYLFASEAVRNELRKKATGTSVYSVSKASLLTLSIILPPIQEQIAISTILQNADREIDLQKQKLAARTEQKKGLMQVLLTGKIRITFN